MDISSFDLKIISGDFKLCVFSNIFFWPSRWAVSSLCHTGGAAVNLWLKDDHSSFPGELFLDLVEKGWRQCFISGLPHMYPGSLQGYSNSVVVKPTTGTCLSRLKRSHKKWTPSGIHWQHLEIKGLRLNLGFRQRCDWAESLIISDDGLERTEDHFPQVASSSSGFLSFVTCLPCEQVSFIPPIFPKQGHCPAERPLNTVMRLRSLLRWAMSWQVTHEAWKALGSWRNQPGHWAQLCNCVRGNPSMWASWPQVSPWGDLLTSCSEYSHHKVKSAPQRVIASPCSRRMLEVTSSP